MRKALFLSFVFTPDTVEHQHQSEENEYRQNDKCQYSYVRFLLTGEQIENGEEDYESEADGCNCSTDQCPQIVECRRKRNVSLSKHLVLLI